MDEILSQIINKVPAHWHTTAVVAALLIPHIGRAVHALRSGGGLVGVWNSVIYGTNVPKQSPQAVLTTPPAASNVTATTTTTTTN